MEDLFRDDGAEMQIAPEENPGCLAWLAWMLGFTRGEDDLRRKKV